MKDAAEMRLKNKAKRAQKFANRKGYVDPDRKDYPTKAAYERHEASEMADERAVEMRLARQSK